MSALRQALQDYLALRHAMGFKLREAHRLLPHFVTFLERQGAVWITTDWAVRWATEPRHVQPAEWASRLRLVRGFAQYHSAVDPRTEIPPPEVLPYRHRRCSPYLYSDAEIAQLIAAAHQLPSAIGLRADTYASVFALLAATGMRISELVALDRNDVDLRDGLLTIRHTKFRKSRCLPLHPTTRQALCRYASLRDCVFPIPNSPSFFVSDQGTRLTHWAVRATFVQLSRQIGLRGPTDSRGPRVHDLRHRFAVQTLVRWYREGLDAERHLPELSTVPRAGQGQRHLLVPVLVPECDTRVAALGHTTPRAGVQEAIVMTTTIALPTLLETFFTERLVRQQQASPHTIASSRDTFCLLLRFGQQRLHKTPGALTLADLDAPVIGAFLEYLAHERGTSPRSRNVRLAAIHAFFHYAALHAPSHSGLIQRVLAIPSTRYERTPIAFLSGLEIDALLAAPDQQRWAGRRDRTLLLVAVQTGLRVSELIGLRWQDIALGTGAHVRCHGKGRKVRCIPLRKDAITALRAWQREQQDGPHAPAFPNARGEPLSRDGVAYLLATHVAIAQQQCASLQGKRITPHVLRHSAAMELLHSGVDCAVIALWLGHESMDTTQMYLHASLELKQRALEKTTPTNGRPGRYRPDDELLAFLKRL